MAFSIRRFLLTFLVLLLFVQPAGAELSEQTLKVLQLKRGVVGLVLGPQADLDAIVRSTQKSEWILYLQAADEQQAQHARQLAESAHLLGTRVFVVAEAGGRIHLGDNVADRIAVDDDVAVTKEELLRALRPGGWYCVGSDVAKKSIKPEPAGADDWSHPFHGPDNNPQSDDKLVRGAFQTQFLGYPKFSPMPEQTVIAGGRIYKAMGHIAHKANQNEMLNTLLCINAYNGVVLWRRSLPEGFMIHRNTMIASDDALYMGDHESCKVFDGDTGEIRAEIRVPEALTDGPTWKWMAMRDGVLYALVGNPEIRVDTQKSARRGLGHWPWGTWKGHDYKDPRTAFGYGRTLVAIDVREGKNKILWHYRDDEFLDARAVCMNRDSLFCYCPEKFLLNIDLKTGKPNWKSTDKATLEAIGPNGKAQHYITGYATTAYMKCNDDYLFFAGPQRPRLAVAKTSDGSLAWTFPVGNLQLVLRDDGVWAAGPQKTEHGFRLDYDTGSVLAKFPSRRACTRATGCADSIFFRASGGTVRVLTATNQAQHIDPMRPPCQDGVLIAGGHLYWGPWMCGCQLSLYGNICLKPKSSAQLSTPLYSDALIKAEGAATVAAFAVDENDWTAYRGGNDRADTSNVAPPKDVKLAWTQKVSQGELPTAPVVAGGMVFVADRSGVIRAYSRDGKEAWKAYTAGPIYYPPAIHKDRLFVGSADGRVYAFEARSGRFLWSFRVAPQDRLIPVYGKLVSRWPVAGGVAVVDGTVYAAAGITHYDGTYVVALDAVTGELKAHNSDSGTLQQEVNNGISMQGNLSIVGDELRFLAGGVYETARYNRKTLECLNTPKAQVTSQFRTAFYPYYPAYGKYVSLDYTCDDGCLLTHDASYEGSLFSNLALEEPLPEGVNKPRKEAARWIRRRGGKPPATLWKDGANRRFTGFIVTPGDLIATGHPDARPEKAFLAAVNIKDGKDTWMKELPAVAVKGGAAIDKDGRVYVVLEDGQLLCYEASE